MAKLYTNLDASCLGEACCIWSSIKNNLKIVNRNNDLAIIKNNIAIPDTKPFLLGRTVYLEKSKKDFTLGLYTDNGFGFNVQRKDPSVKSGFEISADGCKIAVINIGDVLEIFFDIKRQNKRYLTLTESGYKSIE